MEYERKIPTLKGISVSDLLDLKDDKMLDLKIKYYGYLAQENYEKDTLKYMMGNPSDLSGLLPINKESITLLKKRYKYLYNDITYTKKAVKNYQFYIHGNRKFNSINGKLINNNIKLSQYADKNLKYHRVKFTPDTYQRLVKYGEVYQYYHYSGKNQIPKVLINYEYNGIKPIFTYSYYYNNLNYRYMDYTYTLKPYGNDGNTDTRGVLVNGEFLVDIDKYIVVVKE